MKLLFATTNPAKVKKYKDDLKKQGIELVTLKDIDIKLNIEESGVTTLENAYIKAKAYGDATGMVTIGMDNGLYIEELPEEKQPGMHVRRVNGKELTDEEMIEYYTNLAKEYGGRLTAKWLYGMVIYDGKTIKEHTWTKSNFYFVDKPCNEREPGYPLDSISVMPDSNRYWLELTEEEKKKEREKDNKDGVVDFIVNSVNK